jgi:hypothetical protein
MIDTGRIPLAGSTLALYREGLACATAGQYERAVGLYNQVIEARSDFWEAWYERGLVLEELGLYGEAIESYDRALLLEPATVVAVEIWYHRSMALQYGVGDYDAALAGYEHVLGLKPDHGLAGYHRGNVLLYGLNQPQLAVQSYEQVLRWHSKMAEVWRNRGHGLVALGRHREAIASYERALMLAPGDEAAQQGKRLASQQLGLQDIDPTTMRADGLDLEGVTGPDGSFVDLDALAESRGPRLLDWVPDGAVGLSLMMQPMIVVEDEVGRQEIRLFQKRYTVGRDPGSDICVRSRYVSRQHAVLYRVDLADGHYTYQIQDGDLNGRRSTNGIQVDGVTVAVTELRSGSVVVLGPKTRISYQMA